MSGYHVIRYVDEVIFKREVDALQKTLQQQKSENQALNVKFENYKKDIEIKINQENQKIKNEIDKLAKNIEQKELQKKGQAESWISHFNEVFESIKNDKRALKFIENEINKVNYRAKLINSNFDSGNYEATVVAAQEAYIEAKETLFKLELMKKEWDELYIDAKKVLDSFIDNFKKFQTYTIHMKTDEGKDETEDIDVKFWAKTEYETVQNSLNNAKKSWQTIENMSKEDLIDFIKNTSYQLLGIEPMLDSAIKGFVNHIRHQDMQEIIADKLGGYGYQVVDNIWEKGDERGGNILLLQNGEGEKIMISLGYDNSKKETIINWKTDIKEVQTQQERVSNLIDSINESFNAKIDKNQIYNNPNDRKVSAEELDIKLYE